VQDDEEFYFLADVPHVTKNLRAGFSKQNVYLPEDVVKREKLPTNCATIDHLKALLEFQRPLTIKPAPFLKEQDVDCSHFVKMDVGSALHVFHHDVASALRLMVKEHGYPESFLTTAWFVDSVRKWFDLMSSRCQKMALSKANPAKYEESVAFLKDFAAMMCNAQIGEKEAWKPVQTGIQLSTHSMIKLVEYLLSKGFYYVLTARFNQDKLENLFSQIRARSPTPTAYEFKNALKIVTVSQMLHQTKNSSYNNDDATYIADFFALNPQAKQDVQEIEFDHEFILNLIESVDQSEVQPPVNSVVYNLVGYLIHSVEKTKQVKCSQCLSVMKAPESEKSPLQSLVNFRDFTGHSLKRCSESVFFDFFLPMENIFVGLEQTKPEFITEPNIRDQLIAHAKQQLPNPFQKCHCKLTKDKLIARFITLRLKISAKEFARKKREDFAMKRKGGERGSRYMSMKKAVDNMK